MRQARIPAIRFGRAVIAELKNQNSALVRRCKFPLCLLFYAAIYRTMKNKLCHECYSHRHICIVHCTPSFPVPSATNTSEAHVKTKNVKSY